MTTNPIEIVMYRFVRQKAHLLLPRPGPFRVAGTDENIAAWQHQRPRLQCLVGHFAGHLGRRELAEFAIDHRQQFIGGPRGAVLDGLKYAGDVAQRSTGIKLRSVAPEYLATIAN